MIYSVMGGYHGGKTADGYYDYGPIVMDLVYLEGYKERNRQRIENFTRNRKMPFDKLVLCILGMVNESSQNALDRFFASMSEEDRNIIRQQSFSEARQNLKAEAFKEIFDVLAPKAYEKGPGFTRNGTDGFCWR
ncbi:hypothetical protein AGMMS49944_14050 [Spirochaetia bacterium]|nr:hypothetical protein AGMMS49944_14050 [Spirochaetia bacterium]